MSSNHLPFKVVKENFSKEINVPGSKSYANRVLILASLCRDEVVINNIPLSADVEKMIYCLKEVGLQIDVGQGQIIVKNSFPECEDGKSKPLVLYTGDGGTTNRFLIPFLSRGSRKYLIEATGGMRNRPMEEIISSLEKLSVKVEQNQESWISLQGPAVIVENLDVDCSQSTQFATGFSLAFYNSKMNINPLELEASKSYFELTRKLIEEVKLGKKKFDVPVDFSSVSYPLGLSAVSGTVLIKNCREVDHTQADSVLIEILQDIGAKIDWENGSLRCSSHKLLAFEKDCSSCPDLTPTLAFIASFSEGVTKLTNLEVLHHKESDRVDEIIRLLEAFSVKYSYDSEKEEIEIIGNTINKTSYVSYEPAKDHRMVMSAYLFMRMCNGGDLYNHEHVKKSFSNFFEVM